MRPPDIESMTRRRRVVMCCRQTSHGSALGAAPTAWIVSVPPIGALHARRIRSITGPSCGRMITWPRRSRSSAGRGGRGVGTLVRHLWHRTRMSRPALGSQTAARQSPRSPGILADPSTCHDGSPRSGHGGWCSVVMSDVCGRPGEETRGRRPLNRTSPSGTGVMSSTFALLHSCEFLIGVALLDQPL